MTALLNSEIVYNRETRDFDILIDGEYTGSAANFHDAEQIRTAELARRKEADFYAPLGACDICGADAWTTSLVGVLCPEHEHMADARDTDAELAEQGLRPASEDEAGWYVLTSNGQVWATDADASPPARWRAQGEAEQARIAGVLARCTPLDPCDPHNPCPAHADEARAYLATQTPAADPTRDALTAALEVLEDLIDGQLGDGERPDPGVARAYRLVLDALGGPAREVEPDYADLAF